jgi:hypothetical protein
MCNKYKKCAGYWLETLPTGERLFCFKTRTHGKYVEHRFSISDFERLLALQESPLMPILNMLELSVDRFPGDRL